jgi:hypothetical protein
MLQARRAQIAHHLEMAIRQRPEIPDQIRSPVSAAGHADLDSSCHKMVGLFVSVLFSFTQRSNKGAAFEKLLIYQAGRQGRLR